MKKLLACTLLFLSLGIQGQTWIYHPFPQVNSYWDIYQSFHCWTGIPGPVTQSYSIFVSNDTLIGTETYHKLFVPYLRSDSTGCSSASVTQGVYKGCIREDSTAKKVYYIKPFLSTEKLLYDFNLQAGDTILGVLETPGLTKDTVISIDSVQTNGAGGGWVKRWLINSCYNIYIIEGVGSTYGLVEASPGCGPDNMEREIMCMVGYVPMAGYIYPNITDCELITSANSVSEMEFDVQISPNPSAGSFQIKIKESQFQELIVSDIFGSIIRREQIHTEDNILINDLSDGIYILTLVDQDNKKFNKKIICTR